MSNWDKYEKSAKKGPMSLFFRLAGLFIAIAIVVGVAGVVLGWFSGVGTVINQEFSPQALLTKYEWFKNAAAQLDKKNADILVYETRIAGLRSEYEGVRRSDWPRDDRQQMGQWITERAGLVASYNALAAEYNAAMAKINWAFTNVGQLPAGATTPLPREFRNYKTDI